MEQKTYQEIETLCRHIFHQPDIETSSITRMGGLTNFNFKANVNGETLALRLPGEGTEDMINRREEYISTKLANELGIDSELLYFNEANGAKITRYIEGAETMNPDTIKDHQNLTMIAELMHRLHTCQQDTKIIFDVFEMVSEYEQIISQHGLSLYDDYSEIRETIFSYKAELETYNIQRVPCHNDPLCENFVKGKGRMYLIDWEYAGMNDPFWDLADISIEADLSNEDELFLLQQYQGKELTETHLRRMQMNKVFLDFLWCLWGIARSPYDHELIAYAQARYERAKQNIRKLENMA